MQKQFYISGMLPINNLIRKDTFKNVYIMAEYLNEQGSFEGVIMVKDDEKNSHMGLVRGCESDGKYSFVYLSPEPMNTKDSEISQFNLVYGLHLKENQDIYDFPTYFKDIELNNNKSKTIGSDMVFRHAPFAEERKVLLIPNKDALYKTTKLRKIESKKDLLKIEDYIKSKLAKKHVRKNSLNPDRMHKLDKDLSSVIKVLKLDMPENFLKIYNEYIKYETELLETKRNDIEF